MTDYQATFSFLYEPETKHLFNIEEMKEAASDYLCDKIGDFFGFGFQDEVKIIEIYGKKEKALVTFKVTLGTHDTAAVETNADQYKIIGEE
jgi:hypothetical protein